jgi:hypothetical protein
MRTPLPSHLGALREGLVLLRRYPAQALALAVLAMGLAQLGPALELAAGVGPNPLFQTIFGFVGLLPLEMYFIPRLQAQLDAESLNTPLNPLGSWGPAFDGRWLPAFLARLGIGLVLGLGMITGLGIALGLGLPISVGLMLILLPTIVVMTLIGWAPMRMLLRGDAFLPALKWSQAAMARHWPRIIQAVLAMLLVVMVYLGLVGWVMNFFIPATDPEKVLPAALRLKHPAFWFFNLTGGLLNLWLSCSLLALYQRLEASVTGQAAATQP